VIFINKLVFILGGMMGRPIILGIVGDSAAGKTTLTRGIAQVLGPENVTLICTDDYHRYDRQQRAEIGITALHPCRCYAQGSQFSNQFTAIKPAHSSHRSISSPINS
jgi:uridine kinase